MPRAPTSPTGRAARTGGSSFPPVSDALYDFKNQRVFVQSCAWISGAWKKVEGSGKQKGEDLKGVSKPVLDGSKAALRGRPRTPSDGKGGAGWPSIRGISGGPQRLVCPAPCLSHITHSDLSLFSAFKKFITLCICRVLPKIKTSFKTENIQGLVFPSSACLPCPHCCPTRRRRSRQTSSDCQSGHFLIDLFS